VVGIYASANLVGEMLVEIDICSLRSICFKH